MLYPVELWAHRKVNIADFINLRRLFCSLSTISSFYPEYGGEEGIRTLASGITQILA
jgi:hypothetical protein